MLCQFTVKNFKSIRDEMTFDMQTAAISEHEDRVIKDRDGELFLPVSAIYGPNGGGKSNVLEALHSLVIKVLRPLYATSDNENAAIRIKRIVIEPFAFSAETVNAPTEFELFFRTALAEYRYELTVRKDVIKYERLDRVKLETGRRSALFERNENDIMLKGIFSGIGSVIIGLSIGERTTFWGSIMLVMLLGFVAYGLSIYFYVYAQRLLGAARTSAYYAVAPFIAAILSLIVFREFPDITYFTALGLMIVGAWLSSQDKPLRIRKHRKSHIQNDSTD